MPRLNTPVSARPEYYDRTSISILLAFLSVGVAPHAATVRWAYTVPSDKKAFMEFLEVSIYIETASTTPGLKIVTASLTPSGGALNQLLSGRLYAEDNTVADRVDLPIGGTGAVFEGDLVEGRTQDAGGGGTPGTLNYMTIMKATEYDA